MELLTFIFGTVTGLLFAGSIGVVHWFVERGRRIAAETAHDGLAETLEKIETAHEQVEKLLRDRDESLRRCADALRQREIQLQHLSAHCQQLQAQLHGFAGGFIGTASIVGLGTGCPGGSGASQQQEHRPDDDDNHQDQPSSPTGLN